MAHELNPEEQEKFDRWSRRMEDARSGRLRSDPNLTKILWRDVKRGDVVVLPIDPFMPADANSEIRILEHMEENHDQIAYRVKVLSGDPEIAEVGTETVWWEDEDLDVYKKV